MNTSQPSSKRPVSEDDPQPAVGAARSKYAKDWKLEVLALCGFCVSGLFFVAAGLRTGDMLTVIGSVVWIVSCLCWLVPYRKHLS